MHTVFKKSLVLALACLTAAGCSSTAISGAEGEPGEEVVVRHGSSMVPDDTLQDLVTYGDVAVVVDIISEKELPAERSDVERGEGTIIRQITARQVGAPVWTRPSRSKKAPQPERQWTASDGGWVFHGAKRTRMVDEGQDMLLVGSRYLAVSAYTTIGGVDAPEWINLAYFPLAPDGKVRYSQRTLQESSTEMRRLQGATQKTVSSALKTSTPSAKAKPYMELDAFERYQKAMS